jgi:hypothetical protein
MPVDMIVIEWGKFTAECGSVEEAMKVIEKEKVPLQETTIKMRCRIPGIAFESIVEDIKGSGGKIL